MAATDYAGWAQKKASRSPQNRMGMLASQGRNGDTRMAHVSEGEMVIPREVVAMRPDLVNGVASSIQGMGGNPGQYQVGRGMINPRTGIEEFASNFSDSQIKDFVAANINNPEVIAAAAKENGISDDQLAAATGYSNDEINNYFSPVRNRPPETESPSVKEFSFPKNMDRGLLAGLEHGFDNPVNYDSLKKPQKYNGTLSNSQIKDFITENMNDPGAIRNAVIANGVTRDRLKEATGYSDEQIKSYLDDAPMYSHSQIRGFVEDNKDNPEAISAFAWDRNISDDVLAQATGYSNEQVKEYFSTTARPGAAGHLGGSGGSQGGPAGGSAGGSQGGSQGGSAGGSQGAGNNFNRPTRASARPRPQRTANDFNRPQRTESGLIKPTRASARPARGPAPPEPLPPVYQDRHGYSPTPAQGPGPIKADPRPMGSTFTGSTGYSPTPRQGPIKADPRPMGSTFTGSTGYSPTPARGPAPPEPLPPVYQDRHGYSPTPAQGPAKTLGNDMIGVPIGVGEPGRATQKSTGYPTKANATFSPTPAKGSVSTGIPTGALKGAPTGYNPDFDSRANDRSSAMLQTRDKDYSSAVERAADVDLAPVKNWDVTGNQTVQGQVQGLVDEGNPLMEASRRQASNAANSRGMLNSTMASSAGQAAMFDTALDIARPDAEMYGKAASYNADMSNQFSMAQAELDSTNNQFNAGSQNASTLQGSELDFYSDRDYIDNLYKDETLFNDRYEFETETDYKNRKFAEEQHQFDTGSYQNDRDFAEGQFQFDTSSSFNERDFSEDQYRYDTDSDYRDRGLDEEGYQFDSTLNQEQSQFDTTQAFNRDELNAKIDEYKFNANVQLKLKQLTNDHENLLNKSQAAVGFMEGVMANIQANNSNSDYTQTAKEYYNKELLSGLNTFLGLQDTIWSDETFVDLMLNERNEPYKAFQNEIDNSDMSDEDKASAHAQLDNDFDNDVEFMDSYAGDEMQGLIASDSVAAPAQGDIDSYRQRVIDAGGDLQDYDRIIDMGRDPAEAYATAAMDYSEYGINPDTGKYEKN